MKSFILTLASFLTAGCLMAQNHDHIHIYGNDKSVSTIKGAGIETITFDGNTTDGWNRLIVTGTDGNVSRFDMSKIDSLLFRTTAIPEIHVTLQDYPYWQELQGDKEDVHPATIYMIGNGMFEDLAEQTVEFRGRGNSTWGMPKKPYRFKMGKKASVCGLPKAKTFALIANYIDNTLMRNAVALWLANYFRMPYSNHCVPVKVYLNGIDKGQYMLTEKIGIGGGSVDIDETTGMLFEIDSNYDEKYKFRYTWGGDYWYQKNLPVMVKDPDLDELAADPEITTITDANAYFAKWEADFTRMADAVTRRAATESLADVIDLESAVNFFLVNGIAANHEMEHPKSFYIHKKSLDDGEVYHFGPVWDFDWAFTFNGNEGAGATLPLLQTDGDCGGYSFLKLLFENTEFRKLYKTKLTEFIETGYPQLKAYIEEYANLIDPTAVENGNLWPAYHGGYYTTESSLDFRKNLATLKRWLDERLNYMDQDYNFGLYR